MKYLSLFFCSIVLFSIILTSKVYSAKFYENIQEDNIFERVYKQESFSKKESNVKPSKNTKHPSFNKQSEYSLGKSKIQETDLHTKLFVTQKVYPHHTIRAPIVNLIMNVNQDIENGKTKTTTNKTKFTSSISASYLYSLTSDVRIGPEILHTTYNNTSYININDSFSLLLRAELSLYKNSYFDLFTFGGVGISFNTLNLVYTRLTESNNIKGNSYTEYIVKPIINGSSIPHKTAYFYCSAYPRFNNIDIDVIKDPKDPMKGYSEFTGDGFGTCVYQNEDGTKVSTISYEEFTTPERVISIPWFIGIGIDYKISNILSKLMNLNTIDATNSQWSNYGISIGIKYFDNGRSNVIHYRTMHGVDQYTIRYKGYVNINLSLYLKI